MVTITEDMMTQVESNYYFYSYANVLEQTKELRTRFDSHRIALGI